ncbi:hypothetical protein JTE90_023782 [Oedothorax gibbosus]|uniref:Uncharacterized protein n=1 Tax=Oedothorax gibbosus TaxID=931172 RepID=A0AAV6UTD2_9ARAC|nr:hypothetical protein JTE90_023782 [Oedothorax gibbosus]
MPVPNHPFYAQVLKPHKHLQVKPNVKNISTRRYSKGFSSGAGYCVRKASETSHGRERDPRTNVNMASPNVATKDTILLLFPSFSPRFLLFLQQHFSGNVNGTLTTSNEVVGWG